MRLFNSSALFLLLIITTDLHAATYYWYSSFYQRSASSPSQLCKDLKASGGGAFVFTNSTKISAQCLSSSGALISQTNMTRYGDSCPSGTEYDINSGSCKTPPAPGGSVCGTPNPQTGLDQIINSSGQCVDLHMADQESQCSYMGANAGTSTQDVLVHHSGQGAPTPSTIGAMGCEINVLDTAHCEAAPMSCTSSGDGFQVCSASAITKCKVAVSYTGNVAGNASGGSLPFRPISGADDNTEGVCPPGDECKVSPSPELTESQPCNYVQDAEGRMVCSSSKWNHQGGNTFCGTVGGEFQCVEKKPTSNGIQIDTQVETTQNPDGSSTTKKTDTLKNYTCTGEGSCSTSTTKSTQITIKDGNGNTTGVSGSCEGPQCPDRFNNPDGDGDGFGDCTGDNCSEEYGDGPGVETPELDEVPTYDESLAAYWDEIQGAPIVSALGSISLPSGGSCPIYTETIEYIGSISTSSACDLATSLLTPLRYLFLAIWAFAAIRTTMTA